MKKNSKSAIKNQSANTGASDYPNLSGLVIFTQASQGQLTGGANAGLAVSTDGKVTGSLQGDMISGTFVPNENGPGFSFQLTGVSKKIRTIVNTYTGAVVGSGATAFIAGTYKVASERMVNRRLIRQVDGPLPFACACTIIS
jgi:hypothetical protein